MREWIWWVSVWICVCASERSRTVQAFHIIIFMFGCFSLLISLKLMAFSCFQKNGACKKKNAYKIAICNLFVFHVLWTSKKNDSFHVDQFFLLLFILSWFFFIVCCMQIRWNHAQRPKLPVKLSVSNRLVVWYIHWYIHWYIPYIKKISCFQSPDYYHKWRSLTANCLNISEYRVHQ